MLRRRRERGQAVVEFGLLALLFTLILFGIVDFGMLLNGWLSVSAGARDAARRGATGVATQVVSDAAKNFPPPGVARGDLKVTIAYCPTSGACTYYCSYGSGIAPLTDPSGNCTALSSTPPSFATRPDRVDVTVTADTFQVVTPLVRPFFGCGGNQPICNVPLTSRMSMRYEGAGLT